MLCCGTKKSTFKENACNSTIIALFPSFDAFCHFMSFLHYLRNLSCLPRRNHKWIHSVLQTADPRVVQQDRWRNLVANEYGYMSYCCTDVKPADGFHCGSWQGERISLHVSTGCNFWSCEEHAWSAWVKNFHDLNTCAMSTAQTEGSLKFSGFWLLLSFVPEENPIIRHS